MDSQSTYSVGMTVSIGMGLDVDPEDIAGAAGISGSVSWTTISENHDITRG